MAVTSVARTNTPKISAPPPPPPKPTATPQKTQATNKPVTPAAPKTPAPAPQSQGFNLFGAIQSGWNKATSFVQNNVVKPVTQLATQTVPSLFNGAKNAITQKVVPSVANNIVKPALNFATNTAPSWINNNVIKPAVNFATKTAPSWINNNVIKPAVNFATKTVPSLIQTGLRNGFAAAGGVMTKIAQAVSSSGVTKPVWNLLTHNLGGTNRWNSYDGKLLGPPGANGIPTSTTYKPGMPLSTAPGTVPVGGTKNSNVIIYTNGISTDPQTQYRSMQVIANKTGSKVVGNYNATNGAVADIFQTAGDKFNAGNNPAATNLQQMISSELKAGHNVTLIGHSQGAEITARALYMVRDQLTAQGYSQQQIQQQLSRIHVTTFAGASTSYPPGPSYDHYINNNDFVPVAVGLGHSGLPAAMPWNLPGGSNAHYHYFTSGKPIGSPGFDIFANHNIDTTYMDHYP